LNRNYTPNHDTVLFTYISENGIFINYLMLLVTMYETIIENYTRMSEKYNTLAEQHRNKSNSRFLGTLSIYKRYHLDMATEYAMISLLFRNAVKQFSKLDGRDEPLKTSLVNRMDIVNLRERIERILLEMDERDIIN